MATHSADGQVPYLDATALWGALETAAEHAGIGIYIAQIDLEQPRIVYVNACAAEIVGKPAREVVGQAPWSILCEADKPKVRALIERPTGAPPTRVELLVEQPSGRQIPITLAATRVRSDAGVFSFGYFRDISHEREAVEALRRSEARFRFLVEAAPDGVVILQRGIIAFMNPKAAHLLGVDGVEAALGQPIAAFLPPADAALTAERIGKMLREGAEFPPSEYGVLADPARVVEIKSIVCEWNGGPAVLAFARDVTERKAIERRLVESDRLAALGTLAAGVAHEINNPLAYAQLSAQRIGRTIDRLDLPEQARATLRAQLEDIHHGIGRIASVTKSLHSFVSRDDDAAGPVDIEAVLARALKMVDNELRHAARLELALAQVPPVSGNASRLEQVFVNVLINAIKALPANASRPHAIRVELAHRADRVTVAIADTGCGIPAALRSRIFDPFFTTRDVGHGMGLGLSVSKTIVEKLGGEIEVDSIENVGTTVYIHLRPHTHDQASAPRPPAPSKVVPGRRMRVLVVDDEPTICQVLRRILAEHHEVATAAGGAEALRLLAEREFDLLLCDVMMPGMNADELYRRILAQYPHLAPRIVFMSGGALGSDIQNAIQALPNGRLAKPFTVEDVLNIVASFAQ